MWPCTEVAVIDMAFVQRWPLYRVGLVQSGPCTEVALVQRWALYRGGPCTEVGLVQRWPLYRGGPCTEVALVQRWALYREVALDLCCFFFKGAMFTWLDS